MSEATDLKAKEVTMMTLKQLEQRVGDLERQVAKLQGEMTPLRPCRNLQETFGMFADAPDFEEIVRLGREYRDQASPWRTMQLC